MQWLCRLVTPRGGTVLDPFAGTGTTGEAAFREGFDAILIEREENTWPTSAAAWRFAWPGRMSVGGNPPRRRANCHLRRVLYSPISRDPRNGLRTSTMRYVEKSAPPPGGEPEVFVCPMTVLIAWAM